jgi:hypothetical protein
MILIIALNKILINSMLNSPGIKGKFVKIPDKTNQKKVRIQNVKIIMIIPI